MDYSVYEVPAALVQFGSHICAEIVHCMTECFHGRYDLIRVVSL